VTATAPLARRPAVVVAVQGLRHRYGERQALDGIDLEIERNEIVGLLGPNGGGKTTLFRVLATLVRPQEGAVMVLGEDVAAAAPAVRPRLGIVFQHPSLDGKLTVRENLRCHAAFYGLRRGAFAARAAATLATLGLADRADDRVETLSGGLARRAELAKALLHEPELILLDEPSTGLDPGARRDFMEHLVQLRRTAGVTVVLTTHAIEEAERCDRVGFVHHGSLIALGTPDALKAEIGGDVVVVDGPDPERLRARIRQRFGCDPQVVDGAVRIEMPRGHEFVRDVVEAFPGAVRSVTFGKPTLEDVFVHVTGDRFSEPTSP
jgi:ABC-2 type transport system ATP-binding protein